VECKTCLDVFINTPLAAQRTSMNSKARDAEFPLALQQFLMLYLSFKAQRDWSTPTSDAADMIASF
jgi:hypothetical protein